MKTISSALATHLAGEVTTLARCLTLTLVNGTVYRFTDHDQPITFGTVSYLPITVGSPTDIATNAALNADTLDIAGVNTDAGITEADLHAGLWDHAAFSLFQVNYADLTQGSMILRTGRLGEVTMERGQFKTELRGLTQAYARTIGELVSPACRAVLGDARCGVAMGPYTVTGTLTGVADDAITLYDTSRTEPGPTGGYTIFGIARGNPTIVSFDQAIDIVSGQPIVISGVGGITQLNTVVVASNVISTALTSYIDVLLDSTDMPAWTGGGTVAPLGGNSGYFDYGLMTMTSGLSSGFAMEVKSYAPGQIVLQLPFPYALEVGDTYSLTAGCDRSFTTCRDRFSNQLNFRGEPYVPGLDKLIQVGRSG
jgi:hypothetical protein